MDRETALQKMQRYCAYQDRCHREARYKLVELGVYGDLLEEILAELIADNFLNEERFARSFARGKFRLKKWGRQRILRELKQRDVSEYCIRAGLSEIDEVEYRDTITQVLDDYFDKHPQANLFALRQKAVQHAVRRGFELHLAWEAAQKLAPD